MSAPQNRRPAPPLLFIYIAAASSLLFWGGTPVANKIAVVTIDPATTGMLRSILAGPLALVLALALRLPFPAGGRARRLLVVSGITSFAIWPTLLSVGIGLTSASHAGLIIAQIPVVTGLLESLVNREWPRPGWWLGATVAVIGTFFLILYRGGVAGEEASVAGDLIILTGVLACAVGYITGGKLTPVIGTWATTFWGIVLAALTVVPVLAGVAHRTDWPAVETASWLGVSYLAFLGTVGGYLTFYWALAHGGITRISAWQLGQPVITLVLAAVILGESITVPLAAVATAIVAGAAYAQRPHPRAGR